MKAVILAAGRGSRMKCLTDEKPKCLVEVHGKTLLQWQLEALRASGITEIAIVTGYQREKLANLGLFEFYNARWQNTNMASSLACAQSWLEKEPCIISYSDIFYGSEAIQSLMMSKALLAVTYDPNWLELWRQRFDDPLQDAETFRMTSLATLAEISHKPKTINEVQGQYMGLLRITPEGWAEVVRVRERLGSKIADEMHMTRTLQQVIEVGRISISAIPYYGQWGEIDSVEDLMIFNKR